MLLLLLPQRNRLRFALPTSSIDCCSANCFVVICTRSLYSTDTKRLVGGILFKKMSLGAVRTSYVLLCRMADGDDGSFSMCFQRFISFHSKMKKCIPWQYCRTSSLELHTGTRLAITGMRGATGGRKPPSYIYIYTNYVYI